MYPWYPSRMNHSTGISGSIVLRHNLKDAFETFLFGDDDKFHQKHVSPVEALNCLNMNDVMPQKQWMRPHFADFRGNSTRWSLCRQRILQICKWWLRLRIIFGLLYIWFSIYLLCIGTVLHTMKAIFPSRTFSKHLKSKLYILYTVCLYGFEVPWVCVKLMLLCFPKDPSNFGKIKSKSSNRCLPWISMNARCWMNLVLLFDYIYFCS